VGDQDSVQAFKTQPGFKNLALGAFPAVY